jgi:hypothetical protein
LPVPADLRLEDAAVQAGPLLARRTRGIANHQITESIHAIRLTAGQRRRLAGNVALRWIPWAGLDALVLSGPHRRWVDELRQSRAANGPAGSTAPRR